MDNILLYFAILVIAITLANTVSRCVGPQANDVMVLRGKLCRSYYEYKDAGGTPIGEMDKTCWRGPPDSTTPL
jgi:hypothetical protein